MFDIGWTELLVIGVVALIVVGPKDLPGMFRALGQFTARARGMAREFQRAMESAADESGVKDMKREFRDMASGKSFGLDGLDKKIGAGLDPAGPSSAAGAKPGTKSAPAPAPEAPSERGPETEALANRMRETAAARKSAADARVKAASARAAKRADTPPADQTGAPHCPAPQPEPATDPGSSPAPGPTPGSATGPRAPGDATS